MTLSLLQIINSVQGELGLPLAALVAGNTDPTTQQMFYLANRIIDDMRRMHPTGWANCMVEFDIVVQAPLTTNVTLNVGSATIPNFSATIAANMLTGGALYSQWAISGTGLNQAARVTGYSNSHGFSNLAMNMLPTITTQQTNVPITLTRDTYQLPTDYDFTQNRSHWDRTNRWELLGPDSAQLDQWHRSGIVATGPRRHFRKLNSGSPVTGSSPGINTNFPGNQWRIWPPPTEITQPLQLVFEYLSNATVNVNNNSNLYSQYFANDMDTPLLDDQAIVMGIKWKFWQIKGFNYQDMKNDWIDYVNTLIARDEGAGTLSLTKRVHPIFISPANVQDGFFPGPVGPNAA